MQVQEQEQGRMSGLLIAGARYEVPGVIVVSPNDTAWSHLSAGDGRPRSDWPDKILLHKTKADLPERIMPGTGPSGRAERVAEFWQQDPAHSGAHLVIGGDYTACLADLARWEAWHGNQANYRSIGIEHCEESGGVVYQDVLEAGVKICLAVCERMSIQFQVPKPGTYREGKPMRRFTDGGSTLNGLFGHRDVTSSRGRWDPGEMIFEMLIHAGADAFDFDANQDRDVWSERQRQMNERSGYNLVIDGICGPKTTTALRADGYRGGVFALGRSGASGLS